jgi:hypothetical protein
LFDNDGDKYTFPYFNSVAAGGSAGGNVSLDKYRAQVGNKYNIYANDISGKIYLIFTLEGLQDFDFTINIDAFDKNNIYLSYIASSTKYTKDTHLRSQGTYGIRTSLPPGNQISASGLDVPNPNLNGAELRGINLDIQIESNGRVANESGQITTDYTNLLNPLLTGT